MMEPLSKILIDVAIKFLGVLITAIQEGDTKTLAAMAQFLAALQVQLEAGEPGAAYNALVKVQTQFFTSRQ